MRKKQERHPRQPTKRQLARWQQEKRRQRIILGVVALVVVAVIALVGVGFFTTSFAPMRETVLVVNGTRFSMAYYIDMLRHYARGADPNQLFNIANQVPDVIQRNELIRQAALQLGIEVADTDIDQELAKAKLGKEYRDIVRADLLMRKLRDEYFDKQVPANAPQSQVMAMFVESESQALDVRAKIASGADFGELAAQLSVDPFSKEKKGNIGWHTKDILAAQLGSALVADYAFGLDAGTLSQPIQDETKSKQVGYWILKTVDRIPDSKDTKVLAMLLASEEQGKTVKARLAAGEDFDTMARELSQTADAKEKGGDLGYVTRGAMSKALDDFIFNEDLPLGTVSDPIRDDRSTTRGGHWLLKITAREDNRKIDDEERQFLMNKAVNEWVLSLASDPENKIEKLLSAERIAWAVVRVSREGSK